MKNLKPWVEALKIDPKDYNTWMGQAPSFSALTFWCLEREKVPATKYLAWAREHYGLAVLKDTFFEEPSNQEFWLLINSVANWSSSMIPICEWDGVIFVACVEPPHEVNWSFPVRYLLASADNLKKYWAELQSPGQVIARKIEKAKPIAAPEKPKAPPAPIAAPAPMSSPAAEKKSPPIEDALEGISLDLASPTNPEVEMPNGLNLNLSPSAPPPLGGLEGLEGLNLNLSKEDSEIAITGLNSSVLNLSDVIPDRPTMSSEPETEVTSSNTSSGQSMVIMGGMESLSSQSPDETPHHLDAVSDAAATESAPQASEGNFKAFMEDSVIMQRPAEHTFTGSHAGALQVESPKGASIDIKKLAPADINEASSENEAVAWAFKNLKDSFNQSMLLLFEGDAIRPWKWEKSWSPRAEDAFQAFKLNDPGLFRIVKRTKLPYHGHVVPSEANQQFFLNWGLSSLPAHATVLPLMLESQPIGVLLCIGETTANTPQSLVFADRIVMKLINRLSRFEAKAA